MCSVQCIQSLEYVSHPSLHFLLMSVIFSLTSQCLTVSSIIQIKKQTDRCVCDRNIIYTPYQPKKTQLSTNWIITSHTHTSFYTLKPPNSFATFPTCFLQVQKIVVTRKNSSFLSLEPQTKKGRHLRRHTLFSIFLLQSSHVSYRK